MKTIKGNLFMAMYLMGVSLLLFACNSRLDIQQTYEFDIQTMPVRKEIKQNETVEIRCTLIEKGTFTDNQYNIRFFQSDGIGELRLGKDGKIFLPNDRYSLPDKEFRLYYTSKSDESQQFEVVVENSFGNEKRLEFQFNSKKDGKQE